MALVVGAAPKVRDSVALDALEAADAIPALDGFVLDFDHYGRVVGLRITGAAESVLAPSLLEAAERGEPEDGRRGWGDWWGMFPRSFRRLATIRSGSTSRHRSRCHTEGP